MAGLLWVIIVILFIFWLVGLSFHILGGAIYIVLVIAVALLIFNVITGRGAKL
ncbi:MAG: lmo0937 family membrane protein [Vulcanimicrobiaceae bacterium]